MSTLRKLLPVAGALSILGVLTASAYSRSVHADTRCEQVHARIHTDFTAVNCTSPVGLCTAGTVTGGGRLDGATTFMTLDVAPSAGLPAVEPAANLSYSGHFNLTTHEGVLESSDLGVLDASHLIFAEFGRPLSGTGAFANWSGELYFTGALVDNGTGFEGPITGELCTTNDN